MKEIDWQLFWQKLRKYVLNKYVLVCSVFLIIALFVGKQSILQDVRRGRQIKETRAELEKAIDDIDRTKREMETLQNTDSLEKYAREKYRMHADHEDVYIVEEED